MTDATTDGTADADDQIEILHKGSKTVFDEEVADYRDIEVVEVRCDSEEQCRDIGKVVSLLNDYEAEEIREAVKA